MAKPYDPTVATIAGTIAASLILRRPVGEAESEEVSASIVTRAVKGARAIVDETARTEAADLPTEPPPVVG